MTMRVVRFGMAILLGLFLVSCGGGGSSRSSSTVFYSVGSGSRAQIGNSTITFAPDAFTASGDITLSGATTVWPITLVSPMVAPITLATLSTALLCGPGDITLDFACAPDDQIIGVACEDEHTLRPLFTERNSAQTTATVHYTASPDSRAAHSRGMHQFHIGAVKLKFKPKFSETTVGLKTLDGDSVSMSDPNVCLLTHGMNNTVDDWSSLVGQFKKDKRFNKIVGVAYPWPKLIEKNAGDLQQLLEDQVAPGTPLTWISHSMGGLVSSHDLEQLGASDRASTHIMIGTPRTGTSIANETKRCEGQTQDNLNDPNDNPDHWYGLCALDTESVREMIPDSPFLKKLNGATVNKHNGTAYTLIAGTRGTWGFGAGEALCRKYYGGADCDGLVAASSLQDFPYSAHGIFGAVTHRSWPFNHGQLIKSADAISSLSELLDKIKIEPHPALTIESSPANNQGWDEVYSISHHATKRVTTTALTWQVYDTPGDWSTTQWYDPNTTSGSFFPTTQTLWRREIPPGQTIQIPLHLAYDYNNNSYATTDATNRAKTVVIVLTGVLDEGSTNELPFRVVTIQSVVGMNGERAVPLYHYHRSRLATGQHQPVFSSRRAH